MMLKAMMHFWYPAYQCFTFGTFDMTLTIEEYAALLNVPLPLPTEDKVYWYDQKVAAKRQLSKLMDVPASEV
mgnify:CR=1 FL=1